MGSDQTCEVAANRSALTSTRPSGRQFFQGRHLTGCQLDLDHVIHCGAQRKSAANRRGCQTGLCQGQNNQAVSPWRSYGCPLALKMGPTTAPARWPRVQVSLSDWNWGAACHAVNVTSADRAHHRKIQAAAPWNNGTDGNSGKGGGTGSLVGVGASVSTNVSGAGWRRIGPLPDNTRRI
jgi:hypothetical protein